TDEAGDCRDGSEFVETGVCSEIETPEDCGSVESYQCALCINPAAPEVCGDEINNDCGGSEDADEMEEVNELEGETYDDCNKNKYSCEMTEVPQPAEETEPGVCVGGKMVKILR
ncbi:MAG: hypothetical protein AB1668_07630, partial [Nanoarchaeota archaeon]